MPYISLKFIVPLVYFFLIHITKTLIYVTVLFITTYDQKHNVLFTSVIANIKHHAIYIYSIVHKP
jgi:L-rhamnose mutarotase